MIIELINVCDKNRDVFMNIWQYLGYDFSELNGMNLSDNGTYALPGDIEEFIDEANYDSYIIYCGREIAGMAVIKKMNDGSNYFRHFFIMRKFRGKSIGKMAAIKLFDLYEGKWVVSQFDYNVPAIKFWRRTLDEYTNNNYMEYRRIDNKGPQQEFHRKG